MLPEQSDNIKLTTIWINPSADNLDYTVEELAKEIKQQMINDSLSKETKMNSILTYTGKYVNPFHFQPDDFTIEDVAHSLSNKCRYGGHSSQFYSVAEHCTILANVIWEEQRFSRRQTLEYMLAALLHDCDEAYLPDFPTPIKHHFLDLIDPAVAKIRGFIYDYYNLPFNDTPEYVHHLDKLICIPESKRFKKVEFSIGQEQAEVEHIWNFQERELPKLNKHIFGNPPQKAKQMFLYTFKFAVEELSKY